MNCYTLIPLLFLLISVFNCSSLLSAGGAFFGDPPDDHHAWAVHDRHRPQPDIVVPASVENQPPSDAVVLFDGTEASFLKNWRHALKPNRREADWIVQDGYMLAVPRRRCD